MKSLIFLLVFAPTLLHADYLNCPCKVVKITDGDTVHVLDQTWTKPKWGLSELFTLIRVERNIELYIVSHYYLRGPFSA